MNKSPFQKKHCSGIVYRRLIQLIPVLALAACSYHPPAPVEEHSTAIVTRQLTDDGSYYVRKGDTLYAIAFSYGLDTQDVAKWNGISSPYTIYPGQKLQLSAPRNSNRKSTGSDVVQISAVKPPAQTTTRPVTRPVEKEAEKSAPITVKPEETPQKTSEKTVSGNTPESQAKGSAGPTSWQWPTNGRIRRGYVSGNPARNGLDIAGKEGQPVTAAAAGEVVYSGNGLIGYGELIIIKHSETMLSAYAHNKVRLAHEGERVTDGQKIAEMGRNSSDEPNLHFEIRLNGKPVNPLNYLPKK